MARLRDNISHHFNADIFSQPTASQVFIHSCFFTRLETNTISAGVVSDRWLQLYIAQLLLIRIQTRRAAPYFQVLRKLLHVDFLHEDEVPEADIGVEGHGGVVSLSVSVNTEHCVWWREFCVTEAVSWVVEGLALSHRHTAGSHRE